MQRRLAARKLLLAIVLTTCLSMVASLSSRERRHVGAEVPSDRVDRTRTPAGRSSIKSSTSRDNEITTEAGRKVSHRLIGGHLRADARQETLWDDGILLSSAGNGRETKGATSRKDEDDEKKTLSQQVKEGKYGLIQNEIYGSQEPKRPGIISYLGNPEVPKDTIDNLGGLDEDEIWLAENHVLVLRGGKFPGHETSQGSGDSTQTWPPIDDYKAPRRQVKIPSKPKVPPPFPVQLAEGGPIQIIGTNGTKEIGNGTVDYRKEPLLTKGLLPDDGPLLAVIANGTILTPESSRNASSEEENSSVRNKDDKSDILPPGSFPPFYHAIPPGAVFVPPPSNHSDYDEDDQSIYYPPPYSFQYQQDNATAVPPGPLVPGIILPPPPDFFSALEEKKTTTKKYAKRPETTPVPRPRPTYLPPRKLTTKQHKSPTTESDLSRATKLGPSVTVTSGITKTYGRATYKNLTSKSSLAATGKPPSVRTIPYTEVTTSLPDKSTTLDNPDFYNIGPLTENQVTSQENAHKQKDQAWSGLVTSKTIPIVAYYATSTQSTLERPVEVTPASIKSIITTSNPERSPSQASYYFYEESHEPPLRATTPNPSSIYYKTTTESPFYETVTQPRAEEKKKQYYSVETVPSRQTSKDYSIKFIGSPVKNSGPVRYSDSTVTQSSSKYESGSARTQGQRMLPDHAPLYYQAISVRPVVPVQSYYTTSKPQTYYRQEAKSKPIYQYSFEATEYSKQQQTNVFNEYQNVKDDGRYSNHRYDYENESMPRKRVRPQPYKNQQPIYPSTTAHTAISTTDNPQHSYYTQQDEKFLDDVTKEYFTIFGKKIPHKGIPSTTPIYSKSNSITERPDYNVNAYVESYNTPEPPVYKTPNVKVHYGDQSQRPYSLKDDILVNYRQPLPPINPDSEFITVVDPSQQQPPDYRIANREDQPLAPIRAYPSQPLANPRNGGPPTNYVPVVESSEELDEAYPQLPISLEDDIKVNYRDPRPTINPDAEFIDPIPVHENHPEKPKAYFAYRLPGDGGHFYFLTPQAITQRPDQTAGHLFPKSRGARLLRRRRRPTGNV
ncbi:hypothetical protein E2986_03828 [Frieseomelitta varia]|uniref:Adhesive plaque matrix protein n=1 Tax=Frieseomelitta varia TaxID=561572 RepID=A0A833S8Q0_9HYME|nr:adhesive plaque matrix protein [Frieseomelitta varia]KAF3427971.1 hypothetical protein E2986_03828 [Frieseomelitta varia]